MKFHVSPGDGAPGRLAGTIRFVDGDAAVVTLTAGYEGFSLEGGVFPPVTGLGDVDDAARLVGVVLVACRDQSMVVETYRGGSARGDEDRTADVYPAGRHPRLRVER